MEFMSQDRFYHLLMAESPRWLEEAAHYLQEATVWVQEGRSLEQEGSPLVRFYRCIHALKGTCSLMTSELPLAGSILEKLQGIEGLLAIRDRWTEAPSWIPGLRQVLVEIQQDLEFARLEPLQERPSDLVPEAVYVVFNEEEFLFPWSQVLGFVPPSQIQSWPFVPVRGELVMVLASSRSEDRSLICGIAIQNQAGQKWVIPVHRLNLIFQATKKARDSDSFRRVA